MTDQERDSIREELRREIVASALVERPPADGDDLFEAGLLDSLSFMRLLIFIQKRLGVSFDRSDLRIENFKSIDAIADRVLSRRRQAKA